MFLIQCPGGQPLSQSFVPSYSLRVPQLCPFVSVPIHSTCFSVECKITCLGLLPIRRMLLVRLFFLHAALWAPIPLSARDCSSPAMLGMWVARVWLPSRPLLYAPCHQLQAGKIIAGQHSPQRLPGFESSLRARLCISAVMAMVRVYALLETFFGCTYQWAMSLITDPLLCLQQLQISRFCEDRLFADV